MKRDWMMGFPAAALGEQDLDGWCEYSIDFSGRRRPLPLGIPARVHAEWAGKHGSASPGWNKACALIDFEQGNHDWRQDGNEFVVITEAACKTGQAATATAEWNKAQAAIDAEKAERANPVALTGAWLTLRVNGDAQISGLGSLRNGQVLRVACSQWQAAPADDRIQPMTNKAIDEPPATPKADAEGWIAHDGGPFPAVIAGKDIECRLRGDMIGRSYSGRGTELRWSHDGNFGDIVAYRVIG